MSSDAKRLTKERKITAERYFQNKTHIICVDKKLTDDDYVIWVKLIDLQNNLHYRNLCHVAMKKVIAVQKPLLRNKSKMQKKNGSVD